MGLRQLPLGLKNERLHRPCCLQLGDFGVTRILEHTMSMANTTIGTPYCKLPIAAAAACFFPLMCGVCMCPDVSPEICKNMPYAYKSDVWALGVLMYELCALRVPFDARDFAGLRKAILTVSLARSRSLSRRASRLMHCAATGEALCIVAQVQPLPAQTCRRHAHKEPSKPA